MFVKLFLLFTIIPFVELGLLIKIGTVIGTLETIMIIIITGFIGAFMVRAAGIQCLFRIKNDLNSGVIPTDELFNGMLILVSGSFLITPGLITDAAGFVLLLPSAREIIKSYIKRYVKSRIGQRDSDSHIDIQL
jgi:UPF0716 protein FxsA